MAPVSLLIQLCDRSPDKEGEVMATIEEHIDVFFEAERIEAEMRSFIEGLDD